MAKPFTRAGLERLYAKYNHRRFVHPDPLEVVYRYEAPADREVAAVIAASLAYGRVQQILRSLDVVLGITGGPSRYVRETSRRTMGRHFRAFKHRFTTGDEVARLLYRMGRAIERHGDLGDCFVSGLDPHEPDLQSALCEFAKALGPSSLVPDPAKKSACKRLNLLLRWMVRKDAVDPGGWAVDPALLVVPLDTHMHRISKEHGLTTRKSANFLTAKEITLGFARFSPEDPVRYDFALTRPAIGGH